MRLYAGMSSEFIEDAVQNRIASKLRDAFSRHYRFAPSPGEENAWRNSLRAVSQVFQYGKLTDHGLIGRNGLGSRRLLHVANHARHNFRAIPEGRRISHRVDRLRRRPLDLLRAARYRTHLR